MTAVFLNENERCSFKKLQNLYSEEGRMKKQNGIVLALFLLGIFMGAIDSGIVSPAREIIQNGFGIDAASGIWMITIYTLAYAVSMPIISKLADRLGHKKVYTFSIAVFGIGSLLCGLMNYVDSFPLFLTARVIQAIGAGGILPIATTVIGQSFPEEKRGMALGLVGMVYGVATIIGPTLGSSIISGFGIENWGAIFFINVPISIMILLMSRSVPTIKTENKQAIDVLGSIAIGGLVASLMYALTNLNFFKFQESITSTSVYPFLLLALILIPIVIFIEKRAQDPVINIGYFKDGQMIIILAIAMMTGIGLMGMVFVPQFAENTLKISTGSGGYLVTLLAVFSGIAAPISGKLLDTRGAGFVLRIGFACSLIGTLVLALFAAKALTFPLVLLGLIFMGFGVGFTMGAPLNYMVLNKASKEDGASALATMSLVRSMGVAISPNIMIGFIVNAGTNVLPNITKAVMPPNMSLPTTGTDISPELIGKLQSADVTNIADRLIEFLKAVIPAEAQKFALPSIEGSRDLITSTFQSTINVGYSQMFIATAVVAFVGFALTLFLKEKRAREKA